MLVQPTKLAKTAYDGRRRASRGGRDRPRPRRPGPSRSPRCWPAAERRCRQERRQGLRRLPHLRQGRPEPHRPEPLRRGRRADRARAAAATLSRARSRPQARARPGRPSCSTPGSTSRRTFAKGTKMTFVGLPKAEGPRRRHRLSQFAERHAPKPLGGSRTGEAGRPRRRRARPAAPIRMRRAHVAPRSTWRSALADAAGEIVRRYFRQPIAVDDKPDLTPVTIADREAEAAMRALIEQRVSRRTASSARNTARDARRRRVRLGARSDRRHQVLHQRHAAVRHADRAGANAASRCWA